MFATQLDNQAEAAMCMVHAAALVAEYLSMLGEDRFCFSGCALFEVRPQMLNIILVRRTKQHRVEFCGTAGVWCALPTRTAHLLHGISTVFSSSGDGLIVCVLGVIWHEVSCCVCL